MWDARCGSYESGRAVALGTLCRIFSAPQRRNPFLRTYLDQFYVCLGRSARGEPPSLVAMLVNSECLFQAELEGAVTVVPDFVVALRRVLPKVGSSRHTANRAAQQLTVLPVRASCLLFVSFFLEKPGLPDDHLRGPASARSNPNRQCAHRAAQPLCVGPAACPRARPCRACLRQKDGRPLRRHCPWRRGPCPCALVCALMGSG